MRLACVVHRFGADIAGGSEAHCRHVAERLAAHHDVTILTTCAKDHITWRNEYPAGESRLGPLRVLRFRVARQRSLNRFRDASELAFSGTATEAEQEDWFRENGPESPELIEHLRTHGHEYDRVLFWAFRYAEVYFGLPLVADRAVLVPTAEEDPLIRMDILDRFFALPRAFVFLTPEEQALVERRLGGPPPPSVVVGSGLDPAPFRADASSGADVLAQLRITQPFILYLGRVDPNKGCETLIHQFMRFRTEYRAPVQLVLAGPVNMPIPHHPDVRSLGFVDERVREALLLHAALLVVSSRFESLSLALLEGWNYGVAALVNGHCSVLKGQALRSDGALFYHNYDEFARALDVLLGDAALRRQLGQQGLAYVEREYRWPQVIARIETLLASIDN